MSRTLFAILIATLGTGCVQKTLTKPRILGSYPPYGAPKAPPYGRRQAVAVPSAPVSPTTRTAVPVVPVVPVQQGIAVPLQQAPVVEQPPIVVPFDASGQTRPPVPPPANGGQLVPSQPQTQPPPADPGRATRPEGRGTIGDRSNDTERGGTPKGELEAPAGDPPRRLDEPLNRKELDPIPLEGPKNGRTSRPGST